MKTAITIIAELVRSLVLSGLSAGLMLLALTGASATTGYWAWRRWRDKRR